MSTCDKNFRYLAQVSEILIARIRGGQTEGVSSPLFREFSHALLQALGDDAATPHFDPMPLAAPLTPAPWRSRARPPGVSPSDPPADGSNSSDDSNDGGHGECFHVGAATAGRAGLRGNVLDFRVLGGPDRLGNTTKGRGLCPPSF